MATKTKRLRKRQYVSKKYVAQILRPLLQSGQILSNLAFNIRTKEEFAKSEEAPRLAMWQTRWDRQKRNLPSWAVNKADQ